MKKIRLDQHNHAIYSAIKVRENRVYLMHVKAGWYRIYRQGQRSWMAVCVVPSQTPRYTKHEGVSIKGDASNIITKVRETFVEPDTPVYQFANEASYREAMMAIVAGGRIDTKVDVALIKDTEEEL